MLLLSTFESPLIKGNNPVTSSTKPGIPSLNPTPSISSSNACSASQVGRPAPVVTIVSPQPPYATIAHSTMQVVFNVNEPVSTVQYSFDDMPGVQVTGNQFRINNLYGLGVGTHDIVVQATDSAGITGTSYPLVTRNCPGDILGRGKVDIVDVATAAFAFGTKTGDPRFDPRADMDEDGVIDILDIAAIAFKFGTVCSQPSAISQEFQLSQIEPAQNPAIQSDGSVFLHSGEFLYRATDLVIPGRGLDYQFIRSYRSQITGSGYDGPLGDWEHNYDMRLVVQPNGNINFYNGMGRVDTFVSLGGGIYQSPPGVFVMASRATSGGFRLMEQEGIYYIFNPPMTISGSQIAQLSSIRDRNNDTLTFAYDGMNRLSNVTDTLGRLVKYAYGGNGRLSQIQDFMGRTVSFYYNRNDDLVARTGPAVTGTPNGNDFPSGKTTRYSYSSGMTLPDLNHNLLTITNPNEVANGGAPFLANTYGTNPLDPNSFDKTIQQDLGGTSASASACGFGPAGGRLTYQYNKSQNQTTVVDRNGNVKQYMFNALGNPLSLFEFTRGLRPTDPASYVTSFTYNQDGKLTRTVFPQGNSIVNTYDSSNPNRFSQGNLLAVTRIPDISRGGGPNLVTTYTYEPIFNQPQNVTDPRGNTAQYIYDYQEGSPGQILALAQARGVSITNTQATALSLGVDVNGDGITNQQHGNMIEARAPRITLENGTFQTVKTDYWYNQHGQTVRSVDPEGITDTWEYCSEVDINCDGVFTEFPNNQPPPGADPATGGYLKRIVLDGGGLKLVTSYTRNDLANILSVTDPRGITSLFTVNQLNQLVRQFVDADTSHLNPSEPQPLLALNYETDYAYDSNNNLVNTRVENLDGNNTLVASDPFIKTSYLYDILNNPTVTVDQVSGGEPSIGPAQNTTTVYRYDRNQNLVLVKSPVSNLAPTDTAYQPNNVVSTIYDERGLVFKQSRGGIDPLFKTLAANSALLGELGGVAADPATSTTTQSYDLNGNLATLVDGRGNATAYAYDGFDRRVSLTDAFGNVGKVVFDADSNIVDQVLLGPPGGNLPGNPANNVRLSEVRYSYDQLNRVFRVGQSLFNTPGAPDSSVLMTRFLYDRNGRIIRSTTPAGNVRDYSYDGLGRVVDVKSPGSGPGNTARNEAQWQYDNNGNRVKQVQVDRSNVAPDQTFTTLYMYDAANRLIRETDNLGNTYRWSYDSRGDVVSSTDAKGPLIVDTVGLFPFPSTPPGFTMINGDGNKVFYAYDNIGRRITESRPLLVGGVGGNPLDTSNPSIPSGVITTRTSYDPNSRIGSRTDGNGHSTGSAYDSLNRMNTTIYPDGTTNQNSYDKNGNVVQSVDANGNIVTNSYDSVNRLVKVNVNRALGVVGTTQQTFEYDGLSRLTRATDNNDPTLNDTAINVYSYDSLSRVTQEQQGLSSDAHLLSLITGYDNDSNPTQIVYPGGRVIVYRYDAQDRPTMITDNTFPALAISYNYTGNRVLSAAYSDGIHLNATYDGDARPLSLAYAIPGQSPLVQRNYAYDRVSNVVSEQFVDKPGSPSDYSAYDSLYRLTAYAKGEVGPVIPNNTNANPDMTKFVKNKTQWTIDAAQNWPVVQVTKSNVTTTQQRLSNSMNEYSIVNGVPQGYDRNGNLVRDGNNTYSYNFENELVMVRNNSNPNNNATYLWNGAMRVEKQVRGLGGRTLHFFYFGNRIVAESDQNLNPVSQFVYGRTVWPEFEMTQMKTQSGGFIYALDNRGTLAVIDDSGKVAERYDYDAYGRPTFLDPSYNPQPAQSQSTDKFLFKGQLYDPETGFYTIGDRNLDPQNGRFIQRASSDPYQESRLNQGPVGPAIHYNGNPGGIRGPFIFYGNFPVIGSGAQYCDNLEVCHTSHEGCCATTACDNGVCHLLRVAAAPPCDNPVTCDCTNAGTCDPAFVPCGPRGCDLCVGGSCEGDFHSTLRCTSTGGLGCDGALIQKPNYISSLSLSFQFSSVSTTTDCGPTCVGGTYSPSLPVFSPTTRFSYRYAIFGHFTQCGPGCGGPLIIDCGPTCTGGNLPPGNPSSPGTQLEGFSSVEYPNIVINVGRTTTYDFPVSLPSEASYDQLTVQTSIAMRRLLYKFWQTFSMPPYPLPAATLGPAPLLSDPSLGNSYAFNGNNPSLGNAPLELAAPVSLDIDRIYPSSYGTLRIYCVPWGTGQCFGAT